MIRVAFSSFGAIILIVIESYIAMYLKGSSTIQFGGLSPVISIWAMNFFLLFTMFTHYKIWKENREVTKENTSV
ncbi:hypothetical protein [Cytobacillus gottheilii]|uniref:hypothetical protein n=1 Tax=Cytobacillus gottheilii TaxID=859144 RepID=UPI0009BB11E9|nr:hypothetical protein [Cytobacillus gottheilii]